ncbi:MAG: hypothetical protein NNC24_01080, partial [Candidatus Nanosynbacter sp. P11B_S7_bin.28.1]|nr:hypothetical protein [Candidatus Nanosynbacter sp. P11B_S7_bin.28.1]
IIFPNKKAPGKGGHHLTLFYPSTHPSYRISEASRLKLQKSAPDYYQHQLVLALTDASFEKGQLKGLVCA